MWPLVLIPSHFYCREREFVLPWDKLHTQAFFLQPKELERLHSYSSYCRHLFPSVLSGPLWASWQIWLGWLGPTGRREISNLYSAHRRHEGDMGKSFCWFRDFDIKSWARERGESRESQKQGAAPFQLSTKNTIYRLDVHRTTDVRLERLAQVLLM